MPLPIITFGVLSASPQWIKPANLIFLAGNENQCIVPAQNREASRQLGHVARGELSTDRRLCGKDRSRRQNQVGQQLKFPEDVAWYGAATYLGPAPSLVPWALSGRRPEQTYMALNSVRFAFLLSSPSSVPWGTQRNTSEPPSSSL